MKESIFSDSPVFLVNSVHSTESYDFCPEPDLISDFVGCSAPRSIYGTLFPNRASFSQSEVTLNMWNPQMLIYMATRLKRPWVSQHLSLKAEPQNDRKFCFVLLKAAKLWDHLWNTKNNCDITNLTLEYAYLKVVVGGDFRGNKEVIYF